jgi:predicted DNA-binding transcriptional regulator YafY
LRAQLEAHSAGLTLEQLAGVLRMTTRSVRRYLRELALVTEVESVEVRPGGAHLWRIKPSERGRVVALRRTQAYALLAARGIFEVLRGSALFDEIDLALRLVEQVARRPVVRPGVRADRPGGDGRDARIEERFSFVPPAPRAYSHRSEDVDAAFQAVAELSVLSFRYREGTADGKSERGTRVTAHLYALVLHGGTIVCVARDVDRAQTRAFVFDRMSELVASDTAKFELPADFALADWLQGDFGVARASRTVRLLIEFDSRAADAVRARRVHPSQKLAVAADGRVRASLSVPESPEVLAQVRNWVLGFGAAARVLEPRDLAEEVALELRRAAARYT